MKKQDLLGIGTRVIVTRTRDVGTITEKLGDDLVMVQLENTENAIPVFEEFLQRYSDEIFKSFQPIKENEKGATKSLQIKKYPTQKIKNMGAHLIFEPFENADGTRAYQVYFYNDTSALYIASPLLWVKGVLLDEESRPVSVNAGNLEFLMNIALNTLNDAPELEIEIQTFATDGASITLHFLQKLKTKMFTKTNALHPITGEAAHIFPVHFELPTKDVAGDLRKYTQQIVKTQKDIKKKNEARSQIIDWRTNLNQYAHFKNELDLHIQALHSDPKSLSPAEIVQVQMRAFENYLQHSIEVGIPSVFIIHGLGTGRLRDRIAARLKRSENVLHFKNEFHEKYGFGATEVIFKLK